MRRPPRGVASAGTALARGGRGLGAGGGGVLCSAAVLHRDGTGRRGLRRRLIFRTRCVRGTDGSRRCRRRGLLAGPGRGGAGVAHPCRCPSRCPCRYPHAFAPAREGFPMTPFFKRSAPDVRSPPAFHHPRRSITPGVPSPPVFHRPRCSITPGVPSPPVFHHPRCSIAPGVPSPPVFHRPRCSIILSVPPPRVSHHFAQPGRARRPTDRERSSCDTFIVAYQ